MKKIFLFLISTFPVFLFAGYQPLAPGNPIIGDLGSTGDINTLISKTFNWGISTGSANSNDVAVDLALDASSNPCFSGTFYNSTTFTTTIAGTTLTSTGGQDIIFAKYNSAGIAQWAKNYGGNSAAADDLSGGISVDASNNIFLSGYFKNSS
jgi:hypothetical protein